MADTGAREPSDGLRVGEVQGRRDAAASSVPTDVSRHAPRGSRWLIGHYTLAFAVFAAMVLIVYLRIDRSLIRITDGVEQQYSSFLYEGRWLRQIFRTFLSGGGWVVPQWEWSVGYGVDSMTTMLSFEPLTLVSALVPESLSELAYQALIFVRMYLAGLFFCLYALARDRDAQDALCGACAYVFSACLLNGLYWPGSLVGALFLPLVLTGVERMLAGGRPYVLIGGLSLLFVSSYYFAYMIMLALIPYCVVRVVQVEKNPSAKIHLTWLVRLAGCVLISLSIGCSAIVPQMHALFGSARFTSNTVIFQPTYSFLYYLNFIPGFISTFSPGNDYLIGYGATSLLACVALFLERGERRREHRALRIGFVVLTLMMLVPIFGRVMNGNNYASNRWSFVYAMLISYIVCVVAPRLRRLGGRDRRVALVVLCVILVLVLVVNNLRKEAYLASLAVGFFSLALLATGVVPRRHMTLAIVATLLVSSAVAVTYIADYREGGYTNDAYSLGDVHRSVTLASPSYVLTKVDDPTFWRADTDVGALGLRNDGIFLGTRAYSFYYNIYNSRIDRFHTELGLTRAAINFSYKGLGGRSFLEAVTAGSYYLAPSDHSFPVPYYYDDTPVLVDEIADDEMSYEVYAARDRLPLGFTYSHVMARDEYERLSMARKQATLLQAAVVDSDDVLATGLAELTPRFSDSSPTYRAADINDASDSSGGEGMVVGEGSDSTSTSGCSYEDGRIVVRERGATLRLSFEGLPNAETYLSLKNFRYHLPENESDADQTLFERLSSLYQGTSLYQPNTYHKIVVSSDGGGVAEVECTPSLSHMYGGKSDWLVNLGYSEKPVREITLYLPRVGSYSLDDMSVVIQPMDEFDGQIDALKEDVLDNVELPTNGVRGTIDASKDELLFLSIPYSDGWSATVDGAEANIICANTAFMGIALSAGRHSIELRYATPGLGLGMTIGAGGLLAAGVLVVVCELRRRAWYHGGRRRTRHLDQN
mgnify:FL=1